MKQQKFYLIIAILCFTKTFQGFSQKTTFSKYDTLRGSITPERSWWDLKHYDLYFEVSANQKFISGKNKITYQVVNIQQTMQIDLQPPMKLTKAVLAGKNLKFQHDSTVYFIEIENQKIDSLYTIELYFEGHPPISKNPPWTAAFVWEKDSNNNHFTGVSCQGEGASTWWPCKDHPYDEPEHGADIHITHPNHLVGISNGRLLEIKNHDSLQTSHWKTQSPINNYGITISIGDYTHFNNHYIGINDTLTCNYHVLKGNLLKAKNHFQEVHKTLEAFEYWLGPYPFYNDGYKLVQTPFIGMEHQSCIAYGNGFQNGFEGKDISSSGWGLTFDYIIVHETAHEWFGNSITHADAADMWIHESFATYAESLFIEYYYGKNAGSEYILGSRNRILNNKPIIGQYHVNKTGSTDMYTKGANILHTLRQIVNNDEKWRGILKKMTTTYKHTIVSSQEIENFINSQTAIDLNSFFNQYLRTDKIPMLAYAFKGRKLTYYWKNTVGPHHGVANDENGVAFAMPIRIYINNDEHWIYPSEKKQVIKISKKINQVKIDKNFYIDKINYKQY